MNKTDILILGAGLSGIGAACHIRRQLKGKTFTILERRTAIGGTWDLFRYPGIRSDTDMTTFGYSFRPWNKPEQILGDGESIQQYIADTARQYDVTPHIQFGRKVVGANWNGDEKLWTVETLNEASGEQEQWQAQFVIAATGYYKYEQGYTPTFPGQEAFAGTMVHPQHWPQNLDVKDKKMVVIGSGATAVTLVPSLAKMGADVTMLQRTPTFVMAIPAKDELWGRLSRLLPRKLAFDLIRARNIGFQVSLFKFARKFPEKLRQILLKRTGEALGDRVDIKHFAPDYAPWDQRICFAPEGDLFQALRDGKARVVTDQIATFDATGICLKSGQHLDADIIVTATGLNLQLLGGATFSVDGVPITMQDKMVYKGMMIEGVPNLMSITGYTNAAWTLKSDLISEHFCRLVRQLDREEKQVMLPRPTLARPIDATVMGSLNSGYVKRAKNDLPRQGDAAPWDLLKDYYRDAARLRFGKATSPDLVLS